MKKPLLHFFLLALSGAFSSEVVFNETFENSSTYWSWSVQTPVEEAEGAAEIAFLAGIGPDGSTGLSAEVYTPQEENWHIQIPLPEWTVDKNGIYRISLDARGDAPVQISITYSNDDRYKEGFTFGVHETWGHYSGEFSSDISGWNALDITINIGASSGTYQFDNITIEKIDSIDPANEWYKKADQRIDSIRKGTIPINFSTSSGDPIEADSVHIQLTNHRFQFGTSAILTDTIGKADSQWYRTTLPTLFNSITIENDFKWVDYEPTQGVFDTAKINEYCAFADAENLHIRGHVLIWALQKYGFETHWSNLLSPEERRQAIKRRIIETVSRYKGAISEYDVWNEPFHEMAYFTEAPELNENPENTWELLDSAFHWAHQADPSAALYINEYSVIAGGSTNILFKLVAGMLERNVPISGIGAQCHFGNNPIEPEIIRKRIDQLSELGLPIKVTEFDLGSPETGVTLNAEEMAKAYTTFFRTLFSHPAIEGITIWGFWDRLIWNKPSTGNQGSGLFNSDRSIKPVGDSIQYLLQQEWNTDTTVTLPTTGSIRGFYGSYLATLFMGDTAISGTFSLHPDSVLSTIVISQDTATTIDISQKKPQRFFLRSDSNSRTVTIEATNSESVITFRLMDLRGRVLHKSKAEGAGVVHFTTPPLPQGIYIAEIQQGRTVLRQKLLRTR